MIEAIARLIQESGASQVQLNITTNEHGAQIVLNTKLGDMPANATTQVMALRSALSRPLAVGGEIGELDVTFTQQLDQYIDSVAPVAATFSNLNDVKGAVEAVQKKPTKAKTKPASKTNAAPKVEVPETVSESVITFEENVEFDDEADSL
ncbi:MAG: hypothetical protein ACTJFX_08620 [Pseudoalteromonas prydzensis]|jgi:hypothetical protein|tara:strand:- start:2991 stop:3440 length:450 start_codon:yes stop_codon:yes gene_type:complete